MVMMPWFHRSAEGGDRVTETHVATDHVWSDRRIELAADVNTWLERLP